MSVVPSASSSANTLPSTVVSKPGTNALTVHLDAPETGVSSSQRRLAYISPATASMGIAIMDADGDVDVFGEATISGNSGCQASSPILPAACSVTFDIGPISGPSPYTLYVATYDASQSGSCIPAEAEPSANPAPCTGNVLSQGLVTGVTFTGSQTSSTVALSGIPASILVRPLTTGYLRQNGNGLKLWGSGSEKVTVEALDYDGNAIVGAGAPTLSLTAASTTILNAPTQSNASSSPNVWTLTPNTTGGLVQPGVVNLTATATSTDPSQTTASTTVPVTLAHSIVYVDNGTDVLAFYDGSTSANETISSGLNGPRGLAVDGNGTLYVANHGASTVTEYPAGSTSASGSISSLTSPEGVAVDASGDVWIANSAGVAPNYVAEYEQGASSLAVEISTGLLENLGGAAFDPSGDLWIADRTLSTLKEFTPPLNNSSTAATSITSLLNVPVEVASDGSGNIWVASQGVETAGVVVTVGSVTEYSASASYASTVTLGSSNGLNSSPEPQGIAVDASGNVWVGDYGFSGADGVTATPGVYECPAPVTSNTTCTQKLSISGSPLWIAVVPAAVGGP